MPVSCHFWGNTVIFLLFLARSLFAQYPFDCETPYASDGVLAASLHSQWVHNGNPFDEPAQGDFFTFPVVRVAYGLSERAEFSARWDVYRLLRDQHKNYSDMSDLSLSTKLILRKDAVWPIAILLTTKLPNASDENRVGTDETDVMGVILARYYWENLSFGGMAGLAILGNPHAKAAQWDTFDFGLIADYLIAGHFGMAAEISGRYFKRGSLVNRLTSRAGLWKGWRDWKFDLNLSHGLIAASGDMGLTAGFTYLWK